MRYDPDREVVWIWPDHGAPFLVTRDALEDLLGTREHLMPNELLDVCEKHKAYLATIAARKLVRGDVDRNGRAVVMALDVDA